MFVYFKPLKSTTISLQHLNHNIPQVIYIIDVFVIIYAIDTSSPIKVIIYVY